MDWGNCLEAVPGTGDQVVTIACVPHLVVILINAAFVFAGVVALAFIIWGAFKIARSGGDPKQLETARHTIMYAIIGLILVFFSIFIVRLIAVVTGVSCINLDVIGFDTCGELNENTSNCGYQGESVCEDSNGRYCIDAEGNRRSAGSGVTCASSNTAPRN